jgi:hypothetical protein
MESATGDRQRALKGVFKEAGIPGGHAHRFRDTLAVGLLQAGVPMDRVPVLLGHSSIKGTEKHYSPWVRARQEQLEADVRRTWEISVRETKETAKEHGKPDALMRLRCKEIGWRRGWDSNLRANSSAAPPWA